MHFNGFVSDDQLKLLYRKAFLFIFPSFFEGFGLPVLEAMSMGVPTICSNSSSIPEVGGNAVLTFDPHSPEELSTQIQKVIKDPNLRCKMISDGLSRSKSFSVKKTAESTLAVINGVNK